MLLRFRTANHRSLRGEAELSLVAQPRKGEPRSTGPLPEMVRVTGIYGANASGKSNVLDALGFLVKAVKQSYANWVPTGGVPRTPFLFDPKLRSEPSLYEIDMVVQDVRHTYGFEVDDQCVRSEWLYSYPTGSRRRTLFERDGDVFKFGRTLPGPNNLMASLIRSNSLFLSVAAANSHPLLTEIFRWIGQASPIIKFGRGDFSRVAAALSASMVADSVRVDKWVRFADLGVERVRFEGKGELPGLDGQESLLAHFRGGKITFTHPVTGGGSVDLRFEDESDGTQIWLALASYVVPYLALGRLVLVDEVDSSLHPKLSAALIQMFKDPVINRAGGQLIFTSHDVSLLGNLIDDEVLERDEVWFTEKDGAGATTLFPLTDFQPRRGENFERAYLQGRYGAVPYLDIEELRELFAARSTD